MLSGHILGIDLGTTNSAMAVLQGGKPEILVNAEGSRTTPSVVCWKGGECIVGKPAINQQVTSPDTTVYSVKRFIGRAYADLRPDDLAGLHYRIESGEKGRPVIPINGQQKLPEEVSAAVLAKLKADAERLLGEPITQAVITVPAYFDDDQRQATKDAGRIAGLEVLRIVNEPTAAALAFGYRGDGDVKRIMVFDLGGGTFDVSILDVANDLVQVVSTAGDNHLGGDLWDAALFDWLCDKFKADAGFDPRSDHTAAARVLEAARRTKEDLSSMTQVHVNLPFLTATASGPQHMDYAVTREQFEQVTAHLLARLRQPIDCALAGDAANPIGLSLSDLDDVLLVGGSTRMPAVQRFVRELTGKEPNATVNPDEVVALGAAIQGGVVGGSCTGIVLADVNSMALGLRLADGTMNVMIPANTPIPFEASDDYTNAEAHQENAEIVLIQGPNADRADAPENKVLGTAILKLPDTTRAQELDIKATLGYDVDGIIHVKAWVVSTGETVEVNIEGSTKLTDSEVKLLTEGMRRLPAGR